jgi:hypothetical protein
MKIKIYVQDEDLHHFYNFFKNYDNIQGDDKITLKEKIKSLHYFTDFEEFSDLNYLGKMVEVIIDYSDYVKLDYL